MRKLCHLACEEIWGICAKGAGISKKAKANALARLNFPYAHHRKLHTNNVKKRENLELKYAIT